MRFSVILCDPPWSYNDKRTSKSAGMVLSAYPTLSLETLSDLDIMSVCADDAMLCLWCTGPKLPDGIELIEAWGFEYTSVLFTWVKTRPKWPGFDICDLQEKDIYSGIGHYTNSNTEYILGGRRGQFWRSAQDVKQVIVAPRAEHSAKPPEARLRIERLFGDVPRLELFARETAPGWTAIGEAITGQDITVDLDNLRKT